MTPSEWKLYYSITPFFKVEGQVRNKAGDIFSHTLLWYVEENGFIIKELFKKQGNEKLLSITSCDNEPGSFLQYAVNALYSQSFFDNYEALVITPHQESRFDSIINQKIQQEFNVRDIDTLLKNWFDTGIYDLVKVSEYHL